MILTTVIGVTTYEITHREGESRIMIRKHANGHHLAEIAVPVTLFREFATEFLKGEEIRRLP